MPFSTAQIMGGKIDRATYKLTCRKILKIRLDLGALGHVCEKVSIVLIFVTTAKFDTLNFLVPCRKKEGAFFYSPVFPDLSRVKSCHQTVFSNILSIGGVLRHIK